MSAFLKKAPHLTFAIVRRFWQHPRESLLLCRMAWWVTILSVAARQCSLPRALRIVSTPTSKSASEFSKKDQDELGRGIDLVLSADVLVFRPICWKRAAVLHRFLALRGITTRICFGVKPGVADKVEGHAWLEADGQPILEKEPPDYVVTYSFPSDDRFTESAIAFSRAGQNEIEW